MKTIFSAPNPVNSRALAAFLESRGFEVIVRGEERQGLAGVIPPLECWTEVVILDNAREQEALQAVEEYQSSATGPRDSWACPSCGEQIDPQFSECWRCQPAPAKEESSFSDVLAEARRWLAQRFGR